VFDCNAVNLFSKSTVKLFFHCREPKRIVVGAVEMFASTVRHTLSGIAFNASSQYALQLKPRALIDRDVR
jgi:hypothetical protein